MTSNLAECMEQQVPVILVIDDESSICQTLGDVLRDEGYSVFTAQDGESGFDLVLQQKPALVFLDIWMPGKDGIETLALIKEHAPDTEVIMISGHATIANALEAMKRGASDFIEKPLDIEGVLNSTTRAIANSKRRGLHLSDQASDVQSVAGTKGFLSSGLAGVDRGQRTLKDSLILYGQGLHSGMKSGLILEPLPVNSGIQFAQIGSPNPVPVFVDYVESTAFATTLRHEGAVVGTVEHLMAALHAYGISNVLIKCNGEVPIFDGSSMRFCEVIESIGIEEQGGHWYEIAIDSKVEIAHQHEHGNEVITIEPSEKLSITYELHYPAPVGSQVYKFEMNDIEDFKTNIAPARTFGFMSDVEKLQKAGLAAGGRLDNFILIGPDKVVNTELRFPDELARHKILDIMGDLFLIGRPLRAKIHAKMTGHSENIAMLKKIAQLL